MTTSTRTSSTLLERVRTQHAVSRALRARARRAVADSRELQESVRVHELCNPRRVLAPGDFRLRGRVAGMPVGALWADGALDASARLLQQAGLVVALGDVLGDGRRAGLGDSRAALLTLARACDRVTLVELGAGRREPRS